MPKVAGSIPLPTQMPSDLDHLEVPVGVGRSRRNRVSVEQYGHNLSCLRSATANTFQTAHSIVSLAHINPLDFTRPLARQDALLSQYSICHLPEYSAAHNDMSAYRQQHIGVLDDTLRDDVTRHHSCIPQSLRRIVAEMTDVSLLRNVDFLVLGLIQMLAFTGFYIPFIFIGARSASLGAEATAAALILSYMGMANTMGRVAAGWLADRQWTSALNVSAMSLVVTGVCSLLLTTTDTYEAAVVYAVVFGFVIAAFTSLTSAVLVQQVGLARLTNAYGLISVARGLALFVGSPLGGIVYDLTNDYDVVFALSGALFVVAGGIGCAMHVVKTRTAVKKPPVDKATKWRTEEKGVPMLCVIDATDVAT